MSPTINDHAIAFGAHLEVLQLRCHQAGEAFAAFNRAVRRSIARSVRALSRDDRAEYWTFRQTGMPAFDALAIVSRRR